MLYYQMSTGVAAASLVGALVVAALGAWSAVRRAVRIPPADAMRPEAPARYHRSLFAAQPSSTDGVTHGAEKSRAATVRSMVSVIGIAFAVAVLFVGLSFIDVMNVLINQQFVMSMRRDATLSFVQPRSSNAVRDPPIPGTMDVESMRSVPARLPCRQPHAHGSDFRRAVATDAVARRHS